jgi:hypothetical protein
MQVASNDEETQKQGIVFIFMLLKEEGSVGGIDATTYQKNIPFGGGNSPDNTTFPLPELISRIFRCAPVRVGAVHICSKHPPESNSSIETLVNELNPDERHRTKIHHGTFPTCISHNL